MSAFSSLLKTLGGSDAQDTPPTTKPVAQRPVALPPVVTGPIRTTHSKSAPTTPSATSAPLSIGGSQVYKGTAGLSAAGAGGTKRKADDISTDRVVKPFREPRDISSSDLKQKPTRPNGNDPKSPMVPKNSVAATSQLNGAAKPPTKAPSKGSYAEMMARAKEAAQSKPQSQSGLIKHQATEKTKSSKFADRRKAEQGKGRPAGPPGKNGPSSKSDLRQRSASPMKVTKKSDGPKVPKAPLPPLHAPVRPKPPAPVYRGTMGQPSKKPQQPVERKRSRYDEYLGTDEEEDEDGYGYDDDDQYGSEGSSDMEGGFDDIEVEERMGLRAAKEDDAKELALENKLKREKMERKQKLAALAAKRR